MGAWSNLEVSAARVREAHRAAPFVTGSGDDATFRVGVDPKAPEAKTLVSTALLGKLGQYVSRYGSTEGLLDAMASEARMADSLQTLLAYGMLIAEQTAGRNRGGDLYDKDADTFEARLKAAVQAVVSTAPFLLGLTGDTGGTSPGGAFASVMSRTGYDGGW